MTYNKKLLQLVSAVWILIFHLWIQLSGTGLENYIVRTGYIGVDVFFFLSAYTLADREIVYKDFMKDRFLRVYLKLVLFAMFMVAYKGFSLLRLAKIITGIDLISRGNGAFLWFLPAIMIFYLLYPVFIKWDNRYKGLIVVALWLCLSLLSEQVFGYKAIFIFTNRIPVILAGYYLKKHPINKWLMLSGLLSGSLLVYFFGYSYRLNWPVYSIYFVLAIPLVLGLFSLSSYVGESKWVNILAGLSLEVYGLQMTVGTDMVTFLYRQLENRILVNLLMLIGIFSMAFVLNKAYDYLIRIFAKRIRKDA